MAASTPTLQEQLFGLAPRSRIVAGGIVSLLGVGAAIWFWDRGLIWYGSLFCVLLGPALVMSGIGDQARQRRFDAEVARAKAEWSDLRRELALARRTGGNSARLLQARGYREFAVRRWIVRELGDQPGA
jgi:hypothetical protein